MVWLLKSYTHYNDERLQGLGPGVLPCQEEDIEDRHERHQLVPSCCKKPQKSPACLHWTQREKTQSDHDAKKEAAKTGKRREKSTNLELPGTTRAVREASAMLSQPQSPELCLLSPRSVLAEGGSNLNNRVREEM